MPENWRRLVICASCVFNFLSDVDSMNEDDIQLVITVEMEALCKPLAALTQLFHQTKQ